ncbi:MAG: SRPBCC family protein [Bacteroidia bacterium]
MKALKIILLILAGIVVLAVIGVAFLPDERTIERSVIVNTTADKPFKLVNDLRSWTKWSPWYALDTTQVLAFSENAEGEGAWYSWESKDKKLRTGKLTILRSVKPDSVIVKLEFEVADPGEAGFYFEKVGENETKVSQRMHIKADGYFARANIFMMEMFMNPVFDQGLALIKSNAEAMPDEPAPLGKIENLGVSEMPAMMYMAYTDTAKIAEIQNFYQMAYGEIVVKAGMQNLTQAGPNLAHYHMWDPNNGIAVVQCGMQVAEEGKTDGQVEFIKVDAQKVVAADYFGPYEGLGEVHGAIYDYAVKNGIDITDQPYEIYMNDPSTVTDPTMLHTRICYPVK